MSQADFLELLRQSVHELLLWVGFGTIVGLVAKAVMPGRDPGGALATLLMGIAGTVIGCGTLMFFREGQHVTPISMTGFFVAVGGSLILLLFYRVFSGALFIEAEDGDQFVEKRNRRRRKQVLLRDS